MVDHSMSFKIANKESGHEIHPNTKGLNVSLLNELQWQISAGHQNAMQQMSA